MNAPRYSKCGTGVRVPLLHVVSADRRFSVPLCNPSQRPQFLFAQAEPAGNVFRAARNGFGFLREPEGISRVARTVGDAGGIGLHAMLAGEFLEADFARVARLQFRPG